jgi:outer membrane protein assembly factor BamB
LSGSLNTKISCAQRREGAKIAKKGRKKGKTRDVETLLSFFDSSLRPSPLGDFARNIQKVCVMKRIAEVLALLLVASPAVVVQAENWERFRGPNGAGQADEIAIPSEWAADDYLWRQELPGAGHSSPVIWDGRVFVTSGDPATGEQIVMAFDAASGEKAWEKRFASGTHEMHADNSYATSTPAVDAEQLYFLSLDSNRVWLKALTHEGDEVWQRQIGELDEKHGYGTSPIVVGDVVFVVNETDDPKQSAVVGVDRKSGEVRWTVPRGTGKTSYATPFVMQAANGRELVVMSSMGTGVTAYDPATGKIEWQVLEQDLPDRCVSSPIVAGGNVIVSCGSGNNGMHLIALRPGVNGAPPEEVYRLRQGVPNIPTPVVAGDLLFLWHDRGTVACFDAATGDQKWRNRVGGHFHSSPVRIGERIFGVSKTGEVVVIAAGDEFELLGRSMLDDTCQATPAVADGRIVFRTETGLVCVGEATKE